MITKSIWLINAKRLKIINGKGEVQTFTCASISNEFEDKIKYNNKEQKYVMLS